MNECVKDIINTCKEIGVKLQSLSMQMNTALIELKDGKQLFCSFDMLKDLEISQKIVDDNKAIIDIVDSCEKFNLIIDTINNIDKVLVLKTMQGKTILCSFDELPNLY